MCACVCVPCREKLEEQALLLRPHSEGEVKTVGNTLSPARELQLNFEAERRDKEAFLRQVRIGSSE